jgi:hypothetical protein
MSINDGPSWTVAQCFERNSLALASKAFPQELLAKLFADRVLLKPF